MRRLTRCCALLFAVGAAACAGEADRSPVGPTPPVAPETAAGPAEVHAFSSGAGCQTVQFDLVGVPVSFGTFSFAASGDLEGTMTMVFDPATITLAGATVHNSGVAHWEISGGAVPGLSTFDTRFDNSNILVDRPGSPATLYENKGKHRALSGVDKANLTYKGTFTEVPFPEGDHHYQGVICP